MQNPKYIVTPVAESVPYDNADSGLISENLQEFIDGGQISKNESPVQFTVPSGYTRVYHNLSIQDDFTVSVEDGGTLIV